MPLPPPPRIPTGHLRHVEIWSDVECNSGTRIGFIPRNNIYVAQEFLEISGKEELTLSIDANLSAWSDILHKRVLRPVYEDDSYDEYRIAIIEGARSQADVLTRKVTALGIRNDLQFNTDLLIWEMVNGQILLHHELISIDPDDLVDAIIATNLLPSYITKGTIEPTVPLDSVNNWETPLSALEEIARVTRTELYIRRNGSTDYKIDLLDELNSATDSPIIEFGKNQLSSKIVEDATQMATRIYPKGADTAGVEATISDCLFQLTAVTGPPSTSYTIRHWMGGASSFPTMISEADQFNSLYIEDPDGTRHQITDSDGLAAPPYHTATLTFGSSITIDQNPCRMRVDSGGTEMVSLPSPSGITSYGEVPMVLERDDLPAITNLKPAPFNATWTGSGGATTTSVGRPDTRIHYGDAMWKIEGDTDEYATQDNFLMGSAAATSTVLTLTADRPHLSFQLWCYVEAGQIEFYAKGYTGVSTELWRYPALSSGGEYQYDADGNPVRSVTTKVGAWHHLTLEPQQWNFYDMQEDGTEPLHQIIFFVECLQDNTVAYVDALQVVNKVVVAEKFVSGSNASRLWGAAMDAFAEGINAPKTTISISALDLTRLDSTTWPYDELDRGVTAVLRDPGLDYDVTRRIFSVKRNLLEEAITGIEFVEP